MIFVYEILSIFYFTFHYIYIYIYIYESELADLSQRRAEGSFFNTYYTKVLGRVLLFALIAPLTLDSTL